MTSVTLDVPGVSDLTLTRGPSTFRQAEPITLAFAADITTDATKEKVAEQLKRVVISKLEANVPGIAHVTMRRPLPGRV